MNDFDDVDQGNADADADADADANDDDDDPDQGQTTPGKDVGFEEEMEELHLSR